MARLIVVAGASGAGKTFLLENVNRFHPDVRPLKKFTTRLNRTTEPKEGSIDLYFGCEDSQIQDCTYTYHYCSNNYGIRKKDIDLILSQNKSPMVIVASCPTIAKIKKDYPNALVLYVQTILSGEDLKEELIRYRDPIDVEERMRRQQTGLHEYAKYFDKKIFDYVLINNFTGDFLRQVEYLLDREINDGPNSNYVFVVMSFKEEYNKTYQVFKLAGNSLSDYKIQIERVDEHTGGYVITDRIDYCIAKAGLVICDVSEMSPNVFYELGFARGLEKPIIMTAKAGTILPFDLRQYRTIFYNDLIELQKKIILELKSHYGII